MSQFSPEKLLSQESQKSFLENLKKVRLPKFGKSIPTATAAVLVPICVVKGTVSLLYTVRSMQLRNHSGQISFPGGKTDEGESFIETALRETEEEIGVNRKNIDIWGTAPSVPGRNNKILITPVIASLDINLDKLRLNTEEVHSVFTIPLSILCESKYQFHTQFQNGISLPVFVYKEYKVWGITAVITHMFLSCLFSRELYKNDWMKKTIVMNKL